MPEVTGDKIVELIQQYGLPVLWAIIILVVGKIAAKIASGLIAAAMTKSKIEETLVKFAANISYALFMVFNALLSALLIVFFQLLRFWSNSFSCELSVFFM